MTYQLVNGNLTDHDSPTHKSGWNGMKMKYRRQMLPELRGFVMKCLLQTRTSKTQTDQNNHIVKTFSLIIFAEEF